MSLTIVLSVYVLACLTIALVLKTYAFISERKYGSTSWDTSSIWFVSAWWPVIVLIVARVIFLNDYK